MPETAEDKARRVAELTREIEDGAAETDKKSAERLELMRKLRDEDGWNNVQIGNAAGLTRARVSTIFKSHGEPVGTG